MDGRHIQHFRVVVYSLLYFACALLALYVSGAEDGVAAIWPASGIFVAGLLRVHYNAHGLLVAGVGLSSFASNLIGGIDMVTSLGFTIANLVEGLIVFGLMGKRRYESFIEPNTIIRFVIAIAIAGSASALMAAVLAGNFTLPFLWSWASTVILGMATVTPTIMFMFQDEKSRHSLLTLRGAAVIALVALLSIVTFAQTEYPLMFLPMVATAVATYSLGLSGSSMALVVVTGIGSWFTANGYGPISLAFDTVERQVIYFQAFLVCLIASMLPLAIMLSRHKSEAERNLELAETDQLTGLATRRKILARLERAMLVAKKSGEPLAIAMLDIDYFKLINDKFGHEKGDVILEDLTALMRKELEPAAELGRLGGEEFLAIFEGRTARGIFEQCDALRERAARFDWPEHGPEQVTLSIGIAQYGAQHDIPGLMLRDADMALYRAKDGGRNRTLVHAPTPRDEKLEMASAK